MKAEATSWKREPFKEGVPIPLSLEIHKGQIERISKGLIPQEMEDKWFIYFDEPYLFLHRSWTGQPVFKLKFTESPTGYSVSEALLSADIIKGDKGEIEYQGKLVFFLVNNFLLGEKVPFPMPTNSKEPLPGAYQHHISGSGYKEAPSQPKKKWWQIWL